MNIYLVSDTTVKKRLAIPNIIMIVAPVIITLLIGSICLGAVYLTLNNSNGFGFESSGEIYNTSQAVSEKCMRSLNTAVRIQSQD